MNFQSEKLKGCVRAPPGIRATVVPSELHLGSGAALLTCQLVDVGTSLCWLLVDRERAGGREAELSSSISFECN